MSFGPIATLAGSYLQSVLTPTRQSAGLSPTNSGITASAGTPRTDTGQISPFAQLLSRLQQLQQANPAQYAQVTQQISTNLKSAAQTAQTAGNTHAAKELNALATDFTNASQNGQLLSSAGIRSA